MASRTGDSLSDRKPVPMIAFPLSLAVQFSSSAIYHAPGWIPIAQYLIS